MSGREGFDEWSVEGIWNEIAGEALWDVVEALEH